MRKVIFALLVGASVLTACTGTDVPKQADSFAPCCDGLGTCVPSAAAPEGLADRLLQDTCGEALLCAPSAWLEDPDAKAPSCRAPGDLEGRCLPGCLPDIAAQSASLTQASCGAGALCVPCFDPVTGSDTQACRTGSDEPSEPARTFPACCEDAGRCVPAEALLARVSLEDTRRLSSEACAAEEGGLCVPEAWLGSSGATAVACRTAQREGRCLSTCLPDVAARAAELAQETCGGGELCVPCFDPISGESSGACGIGEDAPEDEVEPFSACCGERGRCVPGDVLKRLGSSPAELSHLGSDSCEGEGEPLCVPGSWLEGDGPRADKCRTLGDEEGRCLPSCLPDVQSRAAQLGQQTCEAEELCVPCFDPLSGADTDACALGNDAPSEAPKPYGSCCQDSGRCIPPELVLASVSEREAARLGHDACEVDGAMCVPERWLDGSSPATDACRAPGGQEGRCLPVCLPDVAAQADRLTRETCETNALCVPCFDPVSGSDTGACSVAGDKPVEAPHPYAECCDGHGRCVPEESLLVSLAVEDRAGLGAGSCSAEDRALCVPDRLLEGNPPVSCRVAGDLEGRCLPSCLPSVSAQADLLQQRSCDASERCVPCFDPLTGRDTGACSAGDDLPREPAHPYERCCGSIGSELGICMPVELLSGEQIDALPIDQCSTAGTRCVPRDLVEAPQRLSACTSPAPLGSSPAPGVCLAQCFLPASIRFFVPRGTCDSPRRCVPCSSLDSELPGCP